MQNAPAAKQPGRLTYLEDYTILFLFEARRAFLFAKASSMTSPFTYLKHVREEFTHVVWPTNRTAIGHTLVVIFIAVVIALLVSVLDYFFGSVVSHVTGG